VGEDGIYAKRNSCQGQEPLREMYRQTPISDDWILFLKLYTASWCSSTTFLLIAQNFPKSTFKSSKAAARAVYRSMCWHRWSKAGSGSGGLTGDFPRANWEYVERKLWLLELEFTWMKFSATSSCLARKCVDGPHFETRDRWEDSWAQWYHQNLELARKESGTSSRVKGIAEKCL
jgi:hypothetical protein